MPHLDRENIDAIERDAKYLYEAGPLSHNLQFSDALFMVCVARIVYKYPWCPCVDPPIR